MKSKIKIDRIMVAVRPGLFALSMGKRVKVYAMTDSLEFKLMATLPRTEWMIRGPSSTYIESRVGLKTIDRSIMHTAYDWAFACVYETMIGGNDHERMCQESLINKHFMLTGPEIPITALSGLKYIEMPDVGLHQSWGMITLAAEYAAHCGHISLPMVRKKYDITQPVEVF